jgi:hypothetical protein
VRPTRCLRILRVILMVKCWAERIQETACTMPFRCGRWKYSHYNVLVIGNTKIRLNKMICQMMFQ